MNFEDVARAVDHILKDPLSGKGVLTVGELIADRIMGMARNSLDQLEAANAPGVTNLTTERKKRGRKSKAQKMMEDAMAPLEDQTAPDAATDPDQPF